MSGSDLPVDGAPEPDVAAAELVLGLLEGEDRATALRRVLAEPGFARQVETWRTHFSQLYRAWPEAEVPRGLKERIERSLDSPPVPVAPPQQAAAPRNRLWQGLALGSSLLAASLVLVIALRPAPPTQIAVTQPVPRTAPTPAAVLVAAIDPVKPGDPVSAVYEPATGGLRLTGAALGGTAHSAELWVIPADGVPHSLGVLPEGAATRIDVAVENRARLAAGAVLAVTLEAPGGSPDGKPKGPVVAKGVLAAV